MSTSTEREGEGGREGLGWVGGIGVGDRGCKECVGGVWVRACRIWRELGAHTRAYRVTQVWLLGATPISSEAGARRPRLSRVLEEGRAHVGSQHVDAVYVCAHIDGCQCQCSTGRGLLR